MKYISEIRVGDNSDIKSLLWSPEDNLSVVVHDMETGLDEVIGSKEVPHIKCLGFGLDISDGEYAVVKHTYKTALLHKYIVSTKVETGTVSVWDRRMDVCIMRRGKEPDDSGVSGKKELAIDTTDDVIYVTGQSGSVATMENGFLGGVFVFNLYDMLRLLCRECNMNLMAYEAIHMFSRRGNNTSTVIFDQSIEAKRFFAKMYLDVCRQ